MTLHHPTMEFSCTPAPTAAAEGTTAETPAVLTVSTKSKEPVNKPTKPAAKRPTAKAKSVTTVYTTARPKFKSPVLGNVTVNTTAPKVASTLTSTLQPLRKKFKSPLLARRVDDGAAQITCTTRASSESSFKKASEMNVDVAVSEASGTASRGEVEFDTPITLGEEDVWSANDELEWFQSHLQASKEEGLHREVVGKTESADNVETEGWGGLVIRDFAGSRSTSILSNLPTTSHKPYYHTRHHQLLTSQTSLKSTFLARLFDRGHLFHTPAYPYGVSPHLLTNPDHPSQSDLAIRFAIFRLHTLTKGARDPAHLKELSKSIVGDVRVLSRDLCVVLALNLEDDRAVDEGNEAAAGKSNGIGSGFIHLVVSLTGEPIDTQPVSKSTTSISQITLPETWLVYVQDLQYRLSHHPPASLESVDPAYHVSALLHHLPIQDATFPRNIHIKILKSTNLSKTIASRFVLSHSEGLYLQNLQRARHHAPVLTHDFSAAVEDVRWEGLHEDLAYVYCLEAGGCQRTVVVLRETGQSVGVLDKGEGFGDDEMDGGERPKDPKYKTQKVLEEKGPGDVDKDIDPQTHFVQMMN
ncbi:hypothetical protein HDV05_005402 [Chytridiales sp. JEL 0842]|nr:hypothetical protein HDV05_005402 [Chytridiales sp. JEL 0842]